MSLDGNCGKAGKTNLIVSMMLPVGVVLCMPGQYLDFPPLVAIIAARRRMLATRRCRCSTGISAHLSSRPWRRSPWFWGGCPYWWLHGPIHPKYALWGCSLAILHAAPSCWNCEAEGNQGLPQHGEVWCYHLGSGSYSRKTAWRMALRCFAKCSCRAHPGGICQGVL